MKLWTIYCHTHVESGRRYIGLTSQTMERRWEKHVYAAFRFSKDGRWHFPNAIRKYGPDAFSHEEFAQSRTLEDANATEEVIIAQYNTTNPRFGFNLSKGGGHKPNPVRKNPWDDPGYRARLLPRLIASTQTPQARVNNKIALNTPESRAKRSAISRAQGATPEFKKKISVAFKGKPRTKRTHCRLGHSMDDAYIRPDTGGRQCRVCLNRRSRTYSRR